MFCVYVLVEIMSQRFNLI